MYCPINTAEKAKMKEGQEKITAVLLPIENEVGGIPKSVISDAINKAGLAKHAKKWLPQQGQYILLCVHQHRSQYCKYHGYL